MFNSYLIIKLRSDIKNFPNLVHYYNKFIIHSIYFKGTLQKIKITQIDILSILHK
jgi:hypothetical protein